MPRQLPWLHRGGASRTQVKQPPKPVSKSRHRSDIDNGFFEGTVLASSRKGKERAHTEELEDEFPQLSVAAKRPSNKDEAPIIRSRLPSSSPPPPVANSNPPSIEYMHKGVNRFNLRDDEWMMVEDEFLQTAKLFTRHLHLEEYERLKQRIGKKKNQFTPRPVVPNAKPSIEGQFKKKAKEQAGRQKKAIKDVFSPNKAATKVGDDYSPAPKREISEVASATTSRSANTTARCLPSNTSNTSDTDSDDLNASQRPPLNPRLKQPIAFKLSTRDPSPVKAPSTFAKPTLPASTRPRPSRRLTPFDLWDEYMPNQPSPKASLKPHETKQTNQIPSPTKPFHNGRFHRPPSPPKVSQPSATRRSPTPRKPSRSLDLFDNANTSKQDTPHKESADRLAKRKAEKEKEDRSSKRKFDDIPTFLF